MDIDFDALAWPEPSSLVGFSGNPLIRDSENRDETSLPAAIDNPGSRFIMFCEGKVLVHKEDTAEALFEHGRIMAWSPELTHSVLLGQSDRGAVLAVPVTADLENLPEPWKAYDLRSLLYSGSFSDADVGPIAQAGGLLHWHRMNQFCGACGAASEMRLGGYRRDCPSCGAQSFPRTDPAVIMLAIREDKCLMGRNHNFPPSWYSTLAGFVEPGETLEEAVRRETFEEAGIEIGKVRYFASQPWPFPHSIMIGVHCEAISEAITIDDAELEDCRWFSRDEVRQMIAETHPDGLISPPNRAISSALIRYWAED